ncbi:MAG TPA: rhodanese-like domain-containing protein [Anaerolineaceae bacterium]|nr:rhodanese-like domain-containing protein [Anaerolineaceae bacterium]
MRSKRRKKQDNTLPILLIVVGVLLVIAVLVIVFQTGNPGQQTANLPEQQVPYPDIERVSLEDARQALEENHAVFLDVRTREAYDAGHVPGAVNIPLGELESRLNELDPNQWIITYCT